jgi:Flp pilus assembly protein CpaB
MNNFTNSIGRFFRNKNVVTILGVIAIMLLLYFGYTWQVNQTIRPVRGVPIAAETIQPRKEITDEMITYVDVAQVLLPANAIKSADQILGKYSNYNTVIPKGSLFYTDTVITKDELPDSAFVKVKDGDMPYNFPVDMNSTYGNSIFPGNKIDIYMKLRNEKDVLMVGKLVENIEVLAVKDSSGRHVFENTEEARIPSMLIFGVTPTIHDLIRKASFLSEFDAELFPVPHGGTIPTNGETIVSTEELKAFIEDHTVPVTTTTTPNETAQ